MKMPARTNFLAAAMLAAAPAWSDGLDIDKNLVCAPVEVIDCSPGLPCIKGTPDEMGAPVFMRVDLGGKVVNGPKLNTSIRMLDKTEKEIVLRGDENGYAWTLTVDRNTGRMVITAANREGAFVMFGACMPL